MKSKFVHCRKKTSQRLQAALLLVFLAAFLFVLPGCRSEDPDETEPTTSLTPTPTPTETVTPTPIPTPEPTPTPDAPDLDSMNLITGEFRDDPSQPQPRPIAIMINNTRKALPQIGIASADLMFELPVEGGVTRLMTVFADPKAIPELGSIRSARHNYVDLVASLDALLGHVGGSGMANDKIAALGLRTLDYMRYSQAYWRDEAWRTQRGQEHSVKTTGERISDLIESRDELIGTLDDPEALFDFRHPNDFVPASGDPAFYIHAPFSNYTVAEFYYDESRGQYAKHQFGGPHLDLAVEEAVHFDNVFLLPTAIPVITSSGHVDVDLSAGEGYYASGGRIQAIRWQKGDAFERLRFFDLDDEPLSVNCGKTYIGFLPQSRSIDIAATLPDSSDD